MAYPTTHEISYLALKTHLMRELALGEPPARCQIFIESCRFLDRGNECLVDRFLVCCLGLGERLLWFRFAILEELDLCRGVALCSAFSEIRVVDLVVDLLESIACCNAK